MGERKVVYFCNPMLNTECKKTICMMNPYVYGTKDCCFLTFHKEYAIVNVNGKPRIADDPVRAFAIDSQKLHSL